MFPLFKSSFKQFLIKVFNLRPFQNLNQAVITLNNYGELKKVFGWKEDPILDRPDIYDFDYVEDVNERRIRDAESIAVIIRNCKPKLALEIGTSTGLATLLMAVNAPESKIYTVNIPPEEIISGEGGTLTTIALEKEKIGIHFRERGLRNITQIYANTSNWEPNIGTIDFAFVDGCHDTEFVYNDIRKILKHTKSGSFILWHDFNPDLMGKYNWIKSVCIAIEKLYQDRLLKGRIFHVKDSWVGIYKVD
jgi:hypothetical protein